MFKNYCLVAWRNLTKFSVYSAINLIGLSIGMAASLMILLYVSHEAMYDRFHVHGEQVYKVNALANWGEKTINIQAWSIMFAPLMQDKNPAITNYVRIHSAGKRVVESDAAHRFYEAGLVFSDSSFFTVFTFPLMRGRHIDLGRSNTVVLTEATARKYFGTTDPLGKTLLYDRSVPLEVVGIARDFPSNSTLKYNMIASLSTLATIPREKDGYNHPHASLGSCATYFRIDDPAAVAGAEASIQKSVKIAMEEKFQLIPLLSEHFSLSDTGATRYLGLFVTIALIILALALINYISLATARAGIRAREVGVRKVAGARRSSLVLQFYIESAMLTVFAFVLALVMIQVAMPALMNKLQINVDAGFIWTPAFVAVMAGLLVVCIVLSGMYPALLLTRFRPALVLKGKYGAASSGQWIRKGLTVVQFVASVALIICSLVVQSQLEFLQTKKIGLNKDQVMVINLDPGAACSHHLLQEALRNQSGIHQVAVASNPLYQGGTAGYFVTTPKSDQPLFVHTMVVNPNFFRTLEIGWVHAPGNAFTGAPGEYVVNEAAFSDLALTTDDLGKPMKLVEMQSVIKGVIKDFNFQSLHEPVKGILFDVLQDTARVITAGGGAIYARIDPAANIRRQVATIEKLFHQYQPESPFQYYFLDDAFNKLYQSEDRLANIFSGFTAVGLVIACLGLFGLVTFYTEVRLREIGIRKVLGATLRNILVLLSRDFVLLVIASSLLAAPLSYWLMQIWLSSFPYRITIPLWFFGAAGTAVLLLACITIGVQALRAARSNPVDALRSE